MSHLAAFRFNLNSLSRFAFQILRSKPSNKKIFSQSRNVNRLILHLSNLTPPQTLLSSSYMPPTRAQLVLGGSIVFFVGSSIYVTWKKEEDRKDMRIAVDMDKDRIKKWMENEESKNSPGQSK